ncbi:MAG: protein kinase [Anaerolineae bacterium]|nr:protein kinase [Anaerolineae bacterium]
MADLTGKILANRYRVDSSLGRGGMADVYKVWDQQRAVYLAMKLLREDLAEDKIFLRRFKREAQTLSRLQHPNIVRFYGLEQDGHSAFMIIEFIEGHALRREIFNAGEQMSFKRVLDISQATCTALHYAHAQGMVHCDIKPGNILVDKSGRVLITDFGISRMTEAATSTMVGIGTPAYMSPEQVRGEDPQPTTDIYSFGVLLYEMITGGERPFTGESENSTGSNSERVRWEHLNLDPPSPSKFNPAITPELEAVVMKCIEKEPKDRFPTALDLLNAINGALHPIIGGMDTLPLEKLDTGSFGGFDQGDPLTPSEVPAETLIFDTGSRPAGKKGGLRIWIAAVLGLVIIAVTAVAISANRGPTAEDIMEIRSRVAATFEARELATAAVEDAAERLLTETAPTPAPGSALDAGTPQANASFAGP